MAFNICRFKWWPTVQGGVLILRQIKPEGCGYYYVVRQNSVKEAKQQQQQKKFCHYLYEFKTIYLQLVNRKRSIQMYLCDC